MIVIDATQELLTEYYGSAPVSSMRAIVAIEADKVVGVAGFKLENERMVLFSDISDELREHKGYKRLVVSAYKSLIEIFPGAPVYAKAAPDIEGSCILLKHIGFQHLRGDLWLS